MAKFVFRQKIRVRDSDAFTEALAQAVPGKLSTLIPVLCCLIESWEYEGDPSQPTSYDDLDVLRDFVPMVQAAEAYISTVVPNLGNR